MGYFVLGGLGLFLFASSTSKPSQSSQGGGLLDSLLGAAQSGFGANSVNLGGGAPNLGGGGGGGTSSSGYGGNSASLTGDPVGQDIGATTQGINPSTGASGNDNTNLQPDPAESGSYNATASNIGAGDSAGGYLGIGDLSDGS